MTKFSPYWWDKQPQFKNEKEFPSSSDVVIIGAGFTGLSAAITLSKAGRSVIVVDSKAIDQSGRTTLDWLKEYAKTDSSWNEMIKVVNSTEMKNINYNCDYSTIYDLVENLSNAYDEYLSNNLNPLGDQIDNVDI